MSLVAALQALSTTGAFASRAFLPLLLVGAIARWPQSLSWLPFVPDRPIVLSERLEWLASPWCLAILAALALLEALAERDGDARMILQEIDAPIKAVAAFVTAFALVDRETAAVLNQVAGLEVISAGPSLTEPRTLLALGFALAVGALTFALAAWRSLVFREARDVADDFGLGKPVAWLEELWSAGSLVLAVIAPVVALLVAGAGLIALRLVQVAVERAEERGRRPCGACGTPALPAAAACPACGQELPAPALGAGAAWPDRWFRKSVAEREIELLSRGRCPACAEKRSSEELRAHAAHPCGWPHRADGDRAWAEDLLAAVRRRIVPLALVAALLGLLPVAGTVAAMILARARLGAPLRRHLGATPRFRARWTIRLLAIPLVLGSGIPFVGAACAAGIVVLSGMTWTGAFARELRLGRLGEAIAPAPSPSPSS